LNVPTGLRARAGCSRVEDLKTVVVLGCGAAARHGRKEGQTSVGRYSLTRRLRTYEGSYRVAVYFSFFLEQGVKTTMITSATHTSSRSQGQEQGMMRWTTTAHCFPQKTSQ
jgi:hypothetical protein